MSHTEDNILAFPDRHAIEREAATWLIRLDADSELSADELSQLRAWLDQDPTHGEELGKLIRFYNKMNVLTELAVPLGRPVIQPKKPSWSLLGGMRGLAVAASILTASLVVFTLWNARDTQTGTNGEYVTAIGEQRLARLADGSRVQLNTNSAILVEFNQEFREITLVKGEVFFEVAKDAQRPFRVYAGRDRIQAVGTAFSVYMREHDVSVTVTEGRVALATAKTMAVGDSVAQPPGPRNQRVTAAFPNDLEFTETARVLEAGENVILENNPGPSEASHRDVERVNDPDLDKRLSWRNGLLTFSGDPLDEVVYEISRYTTVSIEIVDPEIQSIRIGGQFRVGDIEAMFGSLEANFGLEVNRIGENHVQLAAAK
jgi:transmembrane sensor